MVSPDVWDVEAQVRFLLPRPIFIKECMSKGSRPRPYSISQKEFGNNFDAIFRKPSPREIEDAQIEDEAFDNINKVCYNNRSEDKKPR